MQLIRNWFLLAPVVLGLLAPTASAQKLQVLTSFLPVYSFSANIAGNLADVENLLPSGVGPHDYQFSPQDQRKIASADVIVVNGLGLEEWLDKSIKAASARKPKVVVEAAAGLKTQLIRGKHVHGKDEEKHSHGSDYDPHIWLDPTLAAHAVTNILRSFQKADPKNAEGYARNAEQYIAKLKKLDADFQAAAKQIKSKPFVTYHNAFPYLVKRYDLNLIGVVEEVADVQPSPRDLHNLTNKMRAKKVGVIFVEPQYSTKLADQIASDLKIRTAVLDTLETGTNTAQAYEEGMRKNLESLKNNLR